MKRILLVAVLLLACSPAGASVLYQQPPSPAGGYYHSSWWDPDGSNYDEYVWDRFILASDAVIDTVRWRGAYDPAYGGGSPVTNFTVAIYGSIPAGSEPDFSHPALVEYEVGDNAGETYAGVFGGATMYDYRFRLPAGFHASAGVPYWVQVEGWQAGFPGWSIAVGIGGDTYHFRCQHVNAGPETGVPTGCWFTAPSGDASFSLATSAVTDVEDGPVVSGLSLRGASPNPTTADRLAVSFSLPNDAPATLALFNAGGRQVSSMEVGGLGAGPHVVSMAGRMSLAGRASVTPGLYFARLSQDGVSRQAKVIVTR